MSTKQIEIRVYRSEFGAMHLDVEGTSTANTDDMCEVASGLYQMPAGWHAAEAKGGGWAAYLDTPPNDYGVGLPLTVKQSGTGYRIKIDNSDLGSLYLHRVSPLEAA